MPAPPLSCPVRACGRPLERRGRSLSCVQGHAFDRARSGYVNLLQPADRRSSRPGDSRVALDARDRLHAAGIGREIFDRLVGLSARCVPDRGIVIDLGCGTGDALAAVADRALAVGIGIDLATDAVDRAARRFPSHTWVVANADRRLPLLDASVDVVLSVQARRNPPECARVLAAGGRLIVSVPAADDLVELREIVLGAPVERLRADGVVAEHETLFTLASRHVARQRRHVDRAALLDLLRGTYRGARTSTASRLEALDRLEVTLASDILVFERR